MMEDKTSDNIFHFEDDLFENNVRETVLRDAPGFVPRNYFPSEKCDEKTFSDVKCNPKLFHYQADYLYYSGKYEEAMEAYIHLETLYKDNTYMCRNVKESIVWCHLKRGSKLEAQNIAQKLLKDAVTFEQQMGSQYLLNVITGKVEDTNTILLRVQSQTESKSVISSTEDSSRQHTVNNFPDFTDKADKLMSSSGSGELEQISGDLAEGASQLDSDSTGEALELKVPGKEP